MIYVFATCKSEGLFTGLLTIEESEIIAMDEEENENGTFYLEYSVDANSQSTHFLEYTKINNSL